MEAPLMENGTSNGHGRRQARHVLALPYPGHGHINPILRLCGALAARGLLVTVVVTEEWLTILFAAVSSFPDNLRLRSIPNVLPSEKHRGADFFTFITAVLTKMHDPVAQLLKNGGLDSPVDAIVADSLLPWSAAIGRRLGVPVVAFFPQAAAVFAALQELKALDGAERPSMETGAAGKEDGFLRYLPRSSSSHFADITSNSLGQSMLKTFTQIISWFTSAHSLLFNSFDELEANALNTLRSNISVPILSVGPCSFNQMTICKEHTDSYYSFLDAQPKNSVLYVSLGSFLPISDADMQELAMGLKVSGHAFMWVVRDIRHMGDLVGGMSIAVPWCDQVKVLSHPSVGGFLTHCGWNSTIESISAGVPMLTYPLMWDQYSNSKLIVDDWKVGFRLKDEKEEGIVEREVISKSVQRLMNLNTDENKDMRIRLQELKKKSCAALAEKGSSAINVGAVVHDIKNQLGSLELCKS